MPLVLTEADSHLGLSNRALASRARRVCLAFPLEGRDGERYRVTGRPVPPEGDRSRTGPRAARDRRRRDAACWSSAARSAPARSTSRRPRRSRTRPTASSTSPARATTRPEGPGPHYVLLDYLDAVRDRAGGRGCRCGARRRVGLRARPVRPAERADPLSARLRRTTRRRTRSGWRTPAPRSCSPTPS